jgi:hypothetical protein
MFMGADIDDTEPFVKCSGEIGNDHDEPAFAISSGITLTGSGYSSIFNDIVKRIPSPSTGEGSGGGGENGLFSNPS